MEIADKKNLIEFLKSRDLWAKKRFGQNFLIDNSILNKIVSSADIQKTDHIIEIGPGLGILTNELCKNAGFVTAIELDRTLILILEENLKSHKNLKIIQQDGLKFTPPSSPYKVVANIPYNITSPILNHFLQSESQPATMTLLVQKEVADRICIKDANSLQKKHSILSLQTALFGEAKIIQKVSKTSFFPIPKVDSAIIHIKIYKKTDENFIPRKEALAILELAKKAFSQKRKKIRNTLLKTLKITSEKIRIIDKNIFNRRPETLSVQEWRALTKAQK